ncbi:hypothetical protein Gogos_011920 [Gossypium gossypioides]|uniref:Uncharacterized protein n=1 Tax=Gossypium gossypioides TaxID=34282 RepID=A0A7J9BR84_GOSGO|nr:hypothetical protein [Gossypium gossypioides]
MRWCGKKGYDDKPTCGDICWRKSGLGKLKCNVDGAIFTDNGCMG